MDERALSERFPIGKGVTTKSVIINTTRNGIVKGYLGDATGTEFVVVQFIRGLVALLPEDLQRNDLEHPRCPSCQCEKEVVAPRRRVRIAEVEDDDEDLEDLD